MYIQKKMDRSRLDVIHSQRSDDLLGSGWEWSTRHIGKVVHRENDIELSVENGKVWFKLRKTNAGKMRLNWANTCPFLQMVMITHFPDVVKNLSVKCLND